MPLKLQSCDRTALDLTPMIDVVFLLIIFFMVATKFSELERDIDLQLPEVAPATPMTSLPKRREVIVQANGQTQLDGQPVTLGQLTARLDAAHREYPALGVVLRGDAACSFQHVAAALTACKDAHISELGITVRIAGTGKGLRRK